jgi:signal peptidase I
MSESGDAGAAAPWRTLWFHPGAAIEQIVAQRSEAGTIGLAAIVAAVEGVLFVSGPLGLLVVGRAASFWTSILVIAIASAIVGVVGFYVIGFLVYGLAKGLGGSGSALATRAALIWSSTPLLVSSAIVLAASFALVEGSSNLGVQIVLAFLNLVGAIWSIVLTVAMLARIQRFAAWRALTAWLVGDVIAAFAIAMLIRAFVFQPFNAPSTSMAPTILAGDYFFVSKWDYGYGRYSFPFGPSFVRGRIFSREPHRGDVIVFRNTENDTDYIKRIIGLPGDRVQLIHGRVFINGTIVDRRPIEPFELRDPFGKLKSVPAYDEILPEGATHRIIQIEGDDGFLSNTPVYETPPGAYFVLGDNRDNSIDSRTPQDKDGLGSVPFDNLIGRVRIIYLSIESEKSGYDGRRSSLRLDRFGRRVE